jgi:D-alanyl-D-alanine carboxypeptidase
VVVLALLVGCGGGSGPPHPVAPRGIDAATSRDLQRLLDQQRRFYGLPGAAAAVVIPGKGTWSGGSGAADRAAGTPMRGDTRFAIASLTKTFTAALALKLVDEQRLALDEPIRRWLPRWPNADRITLRQLLGMTSGVSDFDVRESAPIYRAIEARPRSYWSPKRTLSYAGRPAFAPGARWQYNNANYVLAGLIIERATHSTVARELRKEILGPLGIDDAAVLQPQERVRAAPAHGYGKIAGDRRVRDLSDGSGFVPFESVASSAWASGGMVATPRAVATFADALFRGSLLSAAARRQLLTFVPTDAPPYMAYGLGVGRNDSRRLSQDVFMTLGSIPGFGGTLEHLPGKGITVVVLANHDGANVLAATIADVLLERAARA